MAVTNDKEVTDDNKSASEIDYLKPDSFNWMDEDDDDFFISSVFQKVDEDLLTEMSEEVSYYLIV